MRWISTLIVLLAPVLNGCSDSQPTVSMSSLPESVREARLALCAPCEFADQNAPWNSTDLQDGRPQRRLEKAELNFGVWTIQYEHGGRGRHTHTVVFDIKPNIHVAAGSSCVPSPQVDCEW
jgi:hypothetical protein